MTNRDYLNNKKANGYNWVLSADTGDYITIEDYASSIEEWLDDEATNTDDSIFAKEI